MSLPTTFADPNQDNAVRAAYERYIKACIRSGDEPVNPDMWLGMFMKINGINTLAELNQYGAVAVGEKESVDFVRTPEPPASPMEEAEVTRIFTQMMIDEGMTATMSLMERVRHRMALGDERPMTVKQTVACVMCGDILCRWAR